MTLPAANRPGDRPSAEAGGGEGARPAARAALAMEVFLELADEPEARRAERLAGLRGADPTLADAVERLLRADAAQPPTLLATGGLAEHLAPARTDERGLMLDDLPRLSGQFRVVRLLGRGGAGEVYLGEQAVPKRPVALKRLRSAGLGRRVLSRVTREAHILGRLGHPGIGQIFDAGVIGEGTDAACYLVMEYVDGLPIDAYARRHGLSRRERVGLMIRLCEAVQHAHQRRVIHRDLKPGNVLVVAPPVGRAAEGQVKVLDFGIAAMAGGDGPAAEIGGSAAAVPGDGQSLLATLEHAVAGTPAYMAPEQLDGDAEPDARVDVYALGVMLYQLLAERLPTAPGGPEGGQGARSAAEALAAARNAVITPLSEAAPGTPRDLCVIVERAMARDPAARYQTCDRLAGELQRYLDGRPLEARRDETVYVLATLARRHRVAVGLGLGVALLAAVFTLVAAGMAVRNQRLAESLELSLHAARMGQAQAALRSNDSVRARSLLAAVPTDLRRWEWHHFSRQVDQSIGVWSLPEAVTHLSGWAAGGDAEAAVVAVCGSDGLVATLGGREGASRWATRVPGARGLSVSADGEVVAVNLGEGGWRTLGAADGRALAQGGAPLEPPVPFGPATLRGVHADGSGRVIGVRVFGGVFVWEAGGGEGRLLVDTRLREISASALSDDGRLLALLGERTAVVVDVRTGSEAVRISTPQAVSLAFAPGGAVLALGGVDGSLQLWRWADGAGGLGPAKPGAHASAVGAAAFGPSGRVLASGGHDRLLAMWDVGEDLSLHLRQRQRGSAGPVRGVAFAGADEAVSADTTAQVRRWSDEPSSEPERRSLGAAVLSLTHDRAGGDTAGAGPLAGLSDGRVVRLDASGSVRETLAKLEGEPCRGAVRLTDGTLAATGNSGAVLVWRPGAGRPERIGVFTRQATFVSGLPGETGRTRVLVHGAGAQVAVVDVAAGVVEHTWSVPGGRVRSVAVAPDGTLAVAGTAGGAELFDVRGRRLGELAPAERQVYSVSWSVDGGHAVLTDDQGRWWVWSQREGREVAGSGLSNAGLVTACFLPGADRLATFGADRSVRVWMWPTGEEVAPLESAGGAIRSVLVDERRGTVWMGDGEGVLTVYRGPESDEAKPRAIGAGDLPER